MAKYHGETFHIRRRISTDPDRYQFMTINDGDEMPPELIKDNKKPTKAEERIKDFAEDLADDGKRNYSNDPTRGRKLKGKKK